MAKGLKISSELSLPIDTVTSTMVVYGGKGMGKTNFGSVLVEEMASALLRWSVIDPMGVWWGIRHSADGKGNGVECLILGGPHGDIPIEPTGGAVIADLVVDNAVNVIIDISRRTNGEMWSVADRIKFATDYGRQLFKRQGGLVDGRRREPILQILDEAARFIPQTIRQGDTAAAMCESVWSTITEEARNVGIGVLLLTQRSARLNKNVAELADAMLAFRTVGPNSVNAVMDWLGEHIPKARTKEIVEQLRSLPRGSALVVSPGWLQLEKIVPIRMRHTFDSSATPKPGEKAAKVKGNGAKPNLALYAERMKETIERAKAEDPKALQAKVKELEAKLAKTPVASAAPAKTVMIRDTAMISENAELKRKLEDRQRKATKLVTFMTRSMKPMIEALEKVMQEFAAEAPVAQISEVLTMPAPAPLIVPLSVPLRVAATRTPVDGESRLTGAALKIAGVAAAYGERGIEKTLLATLLGMSSSGGGFGARLSEARTAGAIVTEGSLVRATPVGIAKYSGAFHAPTTTQEVVDLWSSKITGKAREILLHLVSLRGESITRAELAEAVGMSSEGGGFGARLSEARSTALLVEGGGRVAVNRELLFM